MALRAGRGSQWRKKLDTRAQQEEEEGKEEKGKEKRERRTVSR